MKLVAFVEVFLDQVDEFFSDVGLDLQVVWWIEPEDIALTVPFPFAVLLGGLVLEGCVVPIFLKQRTTQPSSTSPPSKIANGKGTVNAISSGSIHHTTCKSRPTSEKNSST